jgi:hypothetical protein
VTRPDRLTGAGRAPNRSDDGGNAGGGAGGQGGTGGAIACGLATCVGDQVCCNASCGVCAPPGGGCTTQICTDLRWYYTCGDRICLPDAGIRDAGMSLPPCGADQKLNGPCPSLGLMCDPRDNTCNRNFVCATEPMVCPL